jgi:radical SAM protein with 4Fe4S-binding SPASM domain
MECKDNRGLLNQLIAEANFDRIPAAVFGELTRRCNLRCRHCFLTDHDGDDELSTREWLGVLDEIAGLGGFIFTISGGEALLRDDVEEIAGHAVELGFFTRLFTNGTLIDEQRIQKLEKVKWQAIEVSMHGATALSHEALTGMPGSFEQTLRAMHLIKDAGITLTMKGNLTTLNRYEAQAMVELAKELGANMHFSPIVTAKEDGDTAPLGYRLDAEELEEVFTVLRSSSDKEITKPELNKDGSKGKVAAIPCSAARASFEIHANGDVTPCTDLPIILGNIRLQNFGAIWYNNTRVERLLQLGDMKVPECMDCEYISYCMRCSGSALAESGSILLPVNDNCRFARSDWKVMDRQWQKKNI